MAAEQLLSAAEARDLGNFKTLYQSKDTDTRAVDSFGRNAMILAALNGCQATVQYLLDQKETDVNWRDYNGFTALHAAAQAGDSATFRTLHQHPATDRQAVNNCGSNALILAAWKGQQEILHFLLDQDQETDLNWKNSSGWTALHAAAQGGHLPTFRFLYQHPAADRQAVDNNECSVLILAAAYGREGIVHYLLDQEETVVNWKNNAGWTALHAAAQCGHLPTFKKLYQHPATDKQAVTKMGKNTLMQAALLGQEEIVQYLLNQKETDLNWKNSAGFTALHAAAQGGHLSTFVKLHQHPTANTQALTKNGNNTLMIAVLRGKETVVQFLLDQKGTDVNRKNNKGLTAVQTAVQGGDLSMFRTLHQHFVADRHVSSNFEGDALIWAAWKGQEEIVQYLLDQMKERGLNWKDEDWLTALHYAAVGGHLPTFLKLYQHPASVQQAAHSFQSNALMGAAWKGKEDIVRFLLSQKETDVNWKDEFGQTALHAAAHGGYLRTFQILFHHPTTEKQVVSFTGSNALMVAAQNGKMTTVEYLLEQKETHVNWKNKVGWTALHAASQGGHLPTFRFLYQHPATDKQAVTNGGGNALMIAAGNGHEAIVQFLLDQKETDVNWMDKDCLTTLHYAAAGGHLLTFTKLYQHPTSHKQAIDNNGKNALMVAAVIGKEEIVQYLLDQKETFVNWKNRAGWTALHAAAQGGHLPTFRKLYQHPDTDKEAVTKSGKNTLMLAALLGQQETVQYLLEQKETDLNWKNSSGWTALHAAAQGGHLPTFIKLYQHPATDKEAVDNNGSNALMIAVQEGQEQIVQYLLHENDREVTAQTSTTVQRFGQNNSQVGSLKKPLLAPKPTASIVSSVRKVLQQRVPAPKIKKPAKTRQAAAAVESGLLSVQGLEFGAAINIYVQGLSSKVIINQREPGSFPSANQEAPRPRVCSAVDSTSGTDGEMLSCKDRSHALLWLMRKFMHSELLSFFIGALLGPVHTGRDARSQANKWSQVPFVHVMLHGLLLSVQCVQSCCCNRICAS